MSNIVDDDKTEDNSLSSSTSTRALTDAIEVVDIPKTCRAEHKDESKPSVDETETQKKVLDSAIYNIKNIQNNYILFEGNKPVASLPQLKGASDVRIDSSIIFIGDDPKYRIEMVSEKVKLIYLKAAENEDTSIDNSSEEYVSSKSTGELQQQSNQVSKEVMTQTPDMHDVLNAEDPCETSPVSQQDSPTDFDDKSQNLSSTDEVSGARAIQDVDDFGKESMVRKRSIKGKKQKENVKGAEGIIFSALYLSGSSAESVDGNDGKSMKKERSSDIPTGEEMLTSVKENFVGNAPGASAEDSDVDELTKGMDNMQMNKHVPNTAGKVQQEPCAAVYQSNKSKDKPSEKTAIAKEKKYIKSSDTFENYVEVCNIPAGIEEDTLKSQIFKEGVFPIPIPRFVYGNNKVLLICRSKEDAVKLSQCTSIDPFRFSLVKGKRFCYVTRTISKNVIEKMRETKKYEEFKGGLTFADIHIKGESPFVFVAPTTFQLSYADILIENLTQIELTPSSQMKSKNEKVNDTSACKGSITNVEEVKNVPQNVLDILSRSEQFVKFTRKINAYSYKNDSLVFEYDNLCKDDLQMITEIVEDLRGREWDEIQVENKDYSDSVVDSWCEDMKKNIGYECCKYIHDKKKVLVYARTYEDFMKVKYFINFKAGKIKAIGRGRRGKTEPNENETKANRQDFSGDEYRGPDRKYGSSGADSRSPNWEADYKNLKEYNTKENIKVYVYEADILRLPVDCIVSPANESLQHGGGVSSEIARAAGYKLNAESRKYIKECGDVPVGKACTTTAGNLRYDCVIHAVGPRWSDYYPHSDDKVRECKLHLYQAVYNSFLEAERRGLKSIALPPISSAIFGVPDEICVVQYARSILDYSRKTKHQSSGLSDIHFIDRNKNIVRKIQKEFNSAFGN